MKHYGKCLLVGILSVAWTNATLNAQVIVIDRYSFSVDDIDEKTEDELLLTVRKAIKKYDKFADLLDDQTMGVSQEAINRFKKLFADNATVYNDVSRRAYTVNYSEYATQINDYLKKDGVKYDIFSASVGDISYDSTGYYYIDVLTRKYLFNGLNSEKEPFYCKSGRTFNMTFTYAIPEDDLGDAKILKINGNLVKECQDKLLIFQPTIGYSMGIVNRTSSDFFQSSLTGLNSDYKLMNNFRSGFLLQKSLNKRNTIFATAGILYQLSQMKSQWNGFFLAEKTDDEGAIFNHLTQISNGVETGKIHGLNIPVGLKFRVADWSSTYLFVNPSFNVNFPILGKFDFEGDLISTGVYESGETILFNLNDNVLTPDRLEYEADLKNKKLNFSTGVEVAFQYIFNSNTALEIGLEFQYGLNSMISSSSNMAFYPDNLLENGLSFTEAYAKKINQTSFGLKISWIFKG
jgi:hypothetical protein